MALLDVRQSVDDSSAHATGVDRREERGHRPVRRRPARTDSQIAMQKQTEAYAVLHEWLPVINRLGLDISDAHRAASRALASGTGFVVEVLLLELVDERTLFRSIAEELGIGFLDRVDPSRLLLREQHQALALGSRYGLPVVRLEQPGGEALLLIGRADIRLAALRDQITRLSGSAGRLRIVPPTVLRTAILSLSRSRLLKQASTQMNLDMPELSARTVVTGWQGAWIGALAIVIPACLVYNPGWTMLWLHTASAVLFFSCIALRVVALGAAKPLKLRRMPVIDPAVQPVYSVLVALYREREVVPQLLVALGKLQWPRGKLEIKFVCEADDRETLEALRAHELAFNVEIIEVPPGLPRTKPKALAYALPLCSGEFVTLFDAEDRPHPLQLVEAWSRFCSEGADLACLQAPLVVTNGGASPLSLMFAFEYAGLFRGLLPLLAGLNLILPLGGTSNHFRRSALVEAGGWDPYNVTEDADLGLRLKRCGYRSGVISYPTLEDAPEKLMDWLPQRVRWFKGWILTWFVHMRNPVVLSRELGPASALMAQVLFLGMVASALIHPVFMITLLYAMARLVIFGAVENRDAMMAGIGFASILCGYGAFIGVGWLTLTLAEKRWLPRIVVLTPFYWMLLSLAAWLALCEVVRRPHHWSKTTHRRARSLRHDRKVMPGPSAPTSAPSTVRR